MFSKPLFYNLKLVMKILIFVLGLISVVKAESQIEKDRHEDLNSICQGQAPYQYFKSLIKIDQKIVNRVLSRTMASVFVTHGGGPMPLFQPQQHQQFSKNLKQIQTRFPNPKGIIVFSAHWQEGDWTLLDHDSPPLYYDYYGFPPQTYNLNYKMSSSSQTRAHIRESLLKQGIQLKTDKKRGYDHGVFIPMMVMYPEIKVPVVQISILKSMDPEAHFRMGVAMRGLKKEGFLILGSGSSVHGSFFEKAGAKWSQSFDQELTARIVSSKNEEDLLNICRDWRKLPNAKQMHPRQEHLIPLFVNLGAHEGGIREPKSYSLYELTLSNYILS